MKMSPILYNTALSPPGRAVWFTAKAIGLELEHREIDLVRKEQMAPDFVKMNPQHTIPLLNDNGTIVWDSHAIMTYLVSKYAKDDSLYPNDLTLRSVVDQRLHFDSGNAFPLVRRTLRPMLFNEESLNHRLREDYRDAYRFTELFLDDNDWVCGNTITIADFSLLSTITSLDTIVPIDEAEFPKVLAWIKRAQTQWPYYSKCNDQGVKEFKELFESCISKFR